MTGITHKQASRYLRADLDGLLTDAQHRELDTHLRACEACRVESESLSSLTARLKNNFQTRWDTQHGPSTNVIANIQSQARRIIMSKRIDFVFNFLGGIAALLVLFFVVTSVISQFQKNPTAANGTQAITRSPQSNDRLIAFTKETDGNFDIYTIHADGSELTNLTNDPARDANPVWSPDGKRIAFESDRTGFKQIYLMNSDGSNIVQLTYDDVDHQLPVIYDSQDSIWSPDGSKILFLQNDQDGKTWTLSSININGENKKTLVSDTRQFAAASWSPAGDYIGLVLFDEPEPDRLLPNIYVIDADGNNLREIRKFFSQEEQIFTPYFWSSDGQSVIFPANKYKPFRETVYELRLNDNTLTTLATIKPSLFDWQNGIALIIDPNKESQPLVWLRPDGTSTELDYQKGKNPASCYIDKERSSRGNLAIGSYCKTDSKVLLYWTNADGSNIQQLPDLEVPVVNGGLTSLTLSPDEKFVTFNFESEDETSLYIWNMEEALRDSSVQPTKLLVGKGKLRYIPSWQPLAEDIVEEEPTPEPTQTDNRLLAFASQEGGNSEIYTVHADGNDLKNITNNSAHDANPFWSPDGKRIAFQSDRNGGYYSQIFLMDADGSNIVQLTTDKGEHMLPFNADGKTNPWSPDGSKLLFLRRGQSEAEWILQAIDINSGDTASFVTGRISFNGVSWSPNGNYIGFILNDPKNTELDKFVSQIHAVNADGTNLVNINSLLPADDDQGWLYTYDWSRDGEAISIITSNMPSDVDYSFGSNSENPYYWKIYEASLERRTLTVLAKSRSPIGGWWQGSYFLRNFMEPTITWVSSDGKITPVNPTKDCKRIYNENTGGYTDGGFIIDQSPNGNVIVGAYCPNGDMTLFLVNPQGTIFKTLLNSPTFASSNTDGDFGWVPTEFTWSQDDKFIAFNIVLNNKIDMYILNVAESTKDPSLPPVRVPVGYSQLNLSPAWQPVP